MCKCKIEWFIYAVFNISTSKHPSNAYKKFLPIFLLNLKCKQQLKIIFLIYYAKNRKHTHKLDNIDYSINDNPEIAK